VLIAELQIDDVARDKLARHGIRRDEVEQVRRNWVVFTRNPRPRNLRSRLMIGPTDGGRLLTVVIVSHDFDDGIWFVKTAWEASRGERAIYLQRR
jgi:uncharacterized DUF497 family protein